MHKYQFFDQVIDVNMIEKASVGDANDSLVLSSHSVDGDMKELTNSDVVYDTVAEEGQPIRPGIVYLSHTLLVFSKIL